MSDRFSPWNRKAVEFPHISHLNTHQQNADELKKLSGTKYHPVFQGHPDDADWEERHYGNNFYVHDPTGEIRAIYYKESA